MLYTSNAKFKVEEEPNKTKKTGFVNFKCVVWHESFLKILDTIIALSKYGYWHRFADLEEALLHLFPFIVILSADYKKQ